MSRPSQANPVGAVERLKALLDHPVVAALAALPAEREAAVVGGLVRDQLLGRPARDVDAVVFGRGAESAAALAERLGGRPIRLGGDRFAAYRIDLPTARLDLWDRAPMSVDDDLRRRDLTINAIAFRLTDHRLLDPFDGLGDLERRRLRATTERSFEDDPLRVVRLARLAAELPGFEPEPATLELARAAAGDLDAVASERIREELTTALSSATVHRAVELLATVGLFPRLWNGAAAGAAVPAERLARFTCRADELDARLGRTAVDRLPGCQATIFDELPRGGTHLRAFHERGLMSNRQLRATERLLKWRRLPATVEARRWFLHRLGELWPAAASYLGSAVRDASWREHSAALIELANTRGEQIFAPPPLLDGYEISEILALPPGPRLGEVAGKLRREQIEGRVTSRGAALEWLGRLSGDAG